MVAALNNTSARDAPEMRWRYCGCSHGERQALWPFEEEANAQVGYETLAYMTLPKAKARGFSALQPSYVPGVRRNYCAAGFADEARGADT